MGTPLSSIAGADPASRPAATRPGDWTVKTTVQCARPSVRIPVSKVMGIPSTSDRMSGAPASLRIRRAKPGNVERRRSFLGARNPHRHTRRRPQI
ncbi:MAG: hypothetical protein MZV64_23685 [Ignavibacteriales bacterium]|nr:hypothetical protein [Ignavibacteriales bacterium]